MFLSINYHIACGISGKTLKNVSLILELLGLVLFLVSFLLRNQQVLLASYFSLASGTMFMTAAGFNIGEMVAIIKKKNFKWRSYHFVLANSIYYLAFIQAPFALGIFQSRIDFDQKDSSLPYIYQKTTAEPGRWRLVTDIDQKFLISNFAGNRDNLVFKIITPGNDWEISATAPRVKDQLQIN